MHDRYYAVFRIFRATAEVTVPAIPKPVTLDVGVKGVPYYIPVFESREAAVEWAGEDRYIVELAVLEEGKQHGEDEGTESSD